MTLEASMARALGLRPKARPATITPGLSVTLSVRQGGTGTVRRFEFTSNTISRLQAQIDAEKAARAHGLTVWAVISIGEPA